MTIIISHIMCDLDALASMIAASKIYPDSKICIVGNVDLYVKRVLKDFEHRFPIIREKNLKKKYDFSSCYCG